MTVQVLEYEPDIDVVPQAIIWRPLKYCTLVVREGEDDLDKYKGASFAIGNEIRFDLRVYHGHIHPEVTVTLYLPEDVRDEKRVLAIVSIVITEMAIPDSAIAWRRGQKFQFGKLDRSPQDGLREREARVLVLKIAASQPGRSATIDKLREEIPRYFELSPADNALHLAEKRHALADRRPQYNVFSQNRHTDNIHARLGREDPRRPECLSGNFPSLSSRLRV